MLMIILAALNQAEGQGRSKPVKLTGTVTDTTFAPVQGALVIVDGQSTGVITNKQGEFKLKIRPDSKTVGVFTTNLGSALAVYEGQATQEFVLTGREVIEATPEMLKGEELVNIGYGTVKKKDLSKNMGYIDGRENISAAYSNIYEMIQGKVPGVQVSGNSIVIRGLNSINAGTEPLFVVDGIVVSSIENISPQQVESIVVLKGSEAAIYGSRAAGGVIVITLKGAPKK